MADSFGFGVFDVGTTPAYGNFDANYTGASVTGGSASDSGLNSFLAGAKDFLGLAKEASVAITNVRAAITGQSPGQVGTGPNNTPAPTPKKTIDPILIIVGAALFWISKNA